MSSMNPRGRTELQMPNNKKWRDKDITSPERTMVWTEPKSKTTERRVPVVYYLCRNGHLEHPHFMEVSLSSTEGLYLRDVMNRLNSLRGKGMANMYSWSSKRSYKNGFVWHDLSENDFIYPAQGQEYVLKGSELLENSSVNFRSHESMSSSSPEKPPPEIQESSRDDCDFPVVVNRRRNQSWSAIDLHEYKVYKAEPAGEYAGQAADASTQTDDKRRRRRMIKEEDENEKDEQYDDHTTELSREEISPPPSNSSPETLESLIKAHRRIVNVESDIRDQTVANNHPSGRIKASAVLMQLISCGSISFKDCSTTSVSEKDQHGFSLISHYKSRILPGVASSNQVVSSSSSMTNTNKEMMIECLNENPRRVQMMEDKEYFSGSLIETKKDEFSALKRSSSYNADRVSDNDVDEERILLGFFGGLRRDPDDRRILLNIQWSRSSKLVLGEKEIEGVRARCIPRHKTSSSIKKQSLISNKDNDVVVSRSSRNLQVGNNKGRHGDETIK